MTEKKTIAELLELAVFNNNSYLEMYIELINNNISTKKEKNKTERHHIIPRQYYKYFNQEVNNSEENLVNLNYCDHVLAHCLLALSFNNDYLSSMSIDACIFVLNSFKIYKSLEEFVQDYDQIKDVLKCNHFVSDAQREKLQAISANSRWYNNGEKETFTLNKPEGWVEGRLKNTVSWQSQKKKARERNKKCHWYNNGTDCTFSEVCPEGWVLGRLVTEKLRQANATRNLKLEEDKKKYICKTTYRWYNNGIKEHRFIINKQPEGWIAGRCTKTKSKKE